MVPGDELDGVEVSKMSEENILAFDVSTEWATRMEDALRAYDELIGDNDRQEVVDFQAALEKRLAGDEWLITSEEAASFVAEMFHELAYLSVEGFEFRNRRIEQLGDMLADEGVPVDHVLEGSEPRT